MTKDNDFKYTSKNIDDFTGRAYLAFEPRVQLERFVNNKNSVFWLENHPDYNSLSKNMIIKGDNLTAMAALRVSWLMSDSEEENKFDMVYIDPPYNVGGNTGYKNTWKGESDGTNGWAGDHGKFLDFMEPRLKMAKLLMKDNGLIFISICDAEYPRLLMLMNEIYGESNLVGTFIWDKKQGSPSESINVLHEYIICFSKNKSKAWKLEQLKPGCKEIIQKGKDLARQNDIDEANKKLRTWIKDQEKKGNIPRGLASYNNIHPVTHRVFASNPSCAQDDNGSRYRGALKHPVTDKECPVPSKGWKWKKDTLLSMVDYNNVVAFGEKYICGNILFGKDEKIVPRKVAYLDEMTKQRPPSIIRTKSSGARDLPNKVKFGTPKPLELLETLISYFPSKNLKVLDFFAGSGTTAHAVYNLNKEDNGSRNYVLIEQMDKTVEQVILPRMEYVEAGKTFGYYNVAQKELNTVDLLKAFHRHAEGFLVSIHATDVLINDGTEGIKIIGFNTLTKTLVSTASHELRTTDSENYFRKELRCLAAFIEKYKAQNVIVYRIENDKITREEPWVGIKQDIFSGTTCESFKFVSLPSDVIKKWRDTMNALEAI